VLEGDARSLSSVKQAVEGVDVVFSCLAMANIFTPATDHSDAVKTIIQAMHDLSVQRIISIASAGVLNHPTGGYRNKEGLPEILTHIEREHERIFESLRDSGLNWTLMCPVFLKEDIPQGRGKYAFEDLPAGSNETGYADLAQTMVALVDNVGSFQKRVGIVSFR
jgi:putative NADH-flavin reductase